MPTWMQALILLLALTSPAWGILLCGYIVYKIDSIRETRNCPVCQSKESFLFLPDESHLQFCWYHGWRYDKVTELEREVLGEYPSAES